MSFIVNNIIILSEKVFRHSKSVSWLKGQLRVRGWCGILSSSPRRPFAAAINLNFVFPLKKAIQTFELDSNTRCQSRASVVWWDLPKQMFGSYSHRRKMFAVNSKKNAILSHFGKKKNWKVNKDDNNERFSVELLHMLLHFPWSILLHVHSHLFRRNCKSWKQMTSFN